MTRKRIVTLLLVGIPAVALLMSPAPASARSKVKSVHRTIKAKTAHDYWQFHKLTNFKSFKILDLRTPKQFARGRIPGAKNVEATKRIRWKLARLSKKMTYMIYCRNGKTGRKTMALMKKLRFKKVYNIADGIIGWNRKKYPLKRGTDND